MRKRLTPLVPNIVSCQGCQIAGDKQVSVSLPGGWTANQYNGDGKYLGWLALQPARHVMNFVELDTNELRHLGSNIKLVEEALRSYFTEPLVRLYVVYFFEYPDDGFHLHIHLIPRLESFGILAWETPDAVAHGKVSSQYTITGRNDRKVHRLMNHLRSHC